MTNEMIQTDQGAVICESRVSELQNLMDSIRIRLKDLPEETKTEIDNYAKYAIEFNRLTEKYGKAKPVKNH